MRVIQKGTHRERSSAHRRRSRLRPTRFVRLLSFRRQRRHRGRGRDVPHQDHRRERRQFKDHTTLVAAVKAAGLVDTLNGAGPFTVFAPTNAAFDKLPAGTVDTLVKPENKAQLTRILTYHVVPGSYSSAQLLADARKHGGKATLKTVQGEPLTVALHDGKLWIIDAKGGKAGISTADVSQSNGVIHVVDTVLMPK